MIYFQKESKTYKEVSMKKAYLIHRRRQYFLG